MRTFYVYILASQRNGTLYVGVTNDLRRRVFEHQSGRIDGFTQEYRTYMLVYAEEYSSVTDAIKREKQLKGGSRAKKMQLIESVNPEWKDLSKT